MVTVSKFHSSVFTIMSCTVSHNGVAEDLCTKSPVIIKKLVNIGEHSGEIKGMCIGIHEVYCYETNSPVTSYHKFSV